jgi:hypothetical protein
VRMLRSFNVEAEPFREESARLDENGVSL